MGGGGRSLVLMEQWKRNTRNSRGRLSTTLNSIAVEAAVTVHGVPRVAEREIQVMSVKLSEAVIERLPSLCLFIERWLVWLTGCCATLGLGGGEISQSVFSRALINFLSKDGRTGGGG